MASRKLEFSMAREFPEPREIPVTREFPRLKLFPPISRKMGIFREFPTRGFPLNISVLRHPLLTHVPYGLVGVYANAALYTVSSQWYFAALCTSAPCWQCSIPLVHGWCNVDRKTWHVWIQNNWWQTKKLNQQGLRI